MRDLPSWPGLAPTLRAGDTTAVDPPPTWMIREEKQSRAPPLAKTGGGVQIRGLGCNCCSELPALLSITNRVCGGSRALAPLPPHAQKPTHETPIERRSHRHPCVCDPAGDLTFARSEQRASRDEPSEPGHEGGREAKYEHPFGIAHDIDACAIGLYLRDAAPQGDPTSEGNTEKAQAPR